MIKNSLKNNNNQTTQSKGDLFLGFFSRMVSFAKVTFSVGIMIKSVNCKCEPSKSEWNYLILKAKEGHLVFIHFAYDVSHFVGSINKVGVTCPVIIMFHVAIFQYGNG